MGKLHPVIPSYVLPWLAQQHMFWVATAPMSSSGHVNVSPKCTEGTFHVVNEHRVWYEDLTGSGVETISHVQENRRITILFHAFEGPPQIVRIYGQGTVYEYGTPEYAEFLLSVETTRLPGSRAIIVIDVIEVMTTCGFSVPLYQFIDYRTKLHDWAVRLESKDRASLGTSSQALHSRESKNEDRTLETPVSVVLPPPKEGMKSWWHTRNVASLDGLPGLRYACDFNNPEAAIVGSTRSFGHSRVPHSPFSWFWDGKQGRWVDVLSGVALGAALTVILTRSGN